MPVVEAVSEVNIEGVADAIVKMVIASLKKDLAESVARIERLEKALREIADNGEHGDYDECIGPAIARASLEEKP